MVQFPIDENPISRFYHISTQKTGLLSRDANPQTVVSDRAVEWHSFMGKDDGRVFLSLG
jgi:hypothetical protein